MRQSWRRGTLSTIILDSRRWKNRTSSGEQLFVLMRLLHLLDYFGHLTRFAL